MDTSAPILIVGQTEYMGMDKMSLTTNEIRRDEDEMSEANILAMLPPWLRYHLSKVTTKQKLK